MRILRERTRGSLVPSDERPLLEVALRLRHRPLSSKRIAQVRIELDDQVLAEAWRVLSLISKDSLSQANPLMKLLVESVVIDELSRPESSAVAALRRAVRERFRQQVPGQALIDAIERLRGPLAVRGTGESGITTAAEPRRERTRLGGGH
jgi:hypothetical protein